MNPGIHLLHHADWSLAAAARIPFTAPLDDPTTLRDWLPARVPGSVQRDLMRAGRLPDLYNCLDLDTVLREVDTQDWWYRAELPAIEPGQRAWLRCDGIDYMAAISINGRELDRRAGMFAPRLVEVTRDLAAGPATLGIRIWGGGALPRWPRSRRRALARRLGRLLGLGILPFEDRLLTWKAPVHYGWDFAPRLLALGIWDDVALHVTGEVALHDLWARADWGEEHGIILRLELNAIGETTVRVHATLTPANFQGDEAQQHVWELSLRPGLQTCHLHWQQARCRPWDLPEAGFPHLYRLRLRLESAGRLLDERETRVGARTIGWDRGTGAGRVRLNGRIRYLRGVNWTPLDLLRGDPDEEIRYRRLLQAAVDAGVNAVRVWGGGGRERRLFYELCDELGLLVWQEMPVACVFADHMPQTREHLDLVRREMQGIIRHLRGHACLYAWCGGNEWGPGRHRRLKALMAETAAQEDPSRRWLPASPGPGDSHQWEVWHARAPFERYARERAPLMSEFGLSAPPSPAALRRILPADNLWPPGDAWLRRKAEPAKLWHYARLFLPASLASLPGPEPPLTLDAFVRAAQEAQARGLQRGIEAYRLRDGAVGTFIWQWNEPWPAICWSVIPYHGEPKRAYHQIARSYAPLAPLARLCDDSIELWVVNDTDRATGPCLYTTRIDETVVWQAEVTVQPGRRQLGRIPFDPTKLQGQEHLHLRLEGEQVLAENDYPLSPALRESPTFSVAVWLRTRIAHHLMRW